MIVICAIFMYYYIIIERLSMKPTNELVIAQAERRLVPIRRSLEEFKVKPGWIKYLRTVLRMSLKDLAKRSGVSLPTAAQAERREEKGNLTIKTLKKMAQAMDCELVYAFVPKGKIKMLLKEKSVEKARALLQRADTHMLLEDQRVEEDFNERVKRLAEKLMQDGDVW